MKRLLCRALLTTVFIGIALLPAFANPVHTYDVVVVGGGTGGSAAALQAARMGARVALLEESPWIGGQMAAAGVSTMDDVGQTRWGIYGEFIDRVRMHYLALGQNVNICLWGGDTIATEPAVARELLLKMMKETAAIDVFAPVSLLKAAVTKGRLESLTVLYRGAQEQFDAAVFIEATEYGSLLPLVGARYRSGNSISPQIAPEGNIQDITYVAVIKEYPQGIPDELRLTHEPPRYQEHAPKFRGTVTQDGGTFPSPFPLNIPSHNAYRAIPNPENPGQIVGDESESWGNISKTSLNSANDHPGAGKMQAGLSARYLEDPVYRRQQEKEAVIKTLGFLWYLQHELEMSWSVDNTQGYSGSSVSDEALSEDLSGFESVLQHFPPIPYVREGRRGVGVVTLTAKDIYRDDLTRKGKNYPTALAVGEYPVDVHGSHSPAYLEKDLGESAEDYPVGWRADAGLFHVPFEALIPEKIEGLVFAEKNISVSRIANGAIRLHPITMHTGQAAGSIAALAAAKDLPPRKISPLLVQQQLWRDGVRLTLDEFADIPADSPYRNGVEWARLYTPVKPINVALFGVDLPATASFVHDLAETALAEGEWARLPEGENFVTRAVFIEQFGRYLSSETRSYWGEQADSQQLVTRGEASLFLLEAALLREKQ